MNFDLNLDKAIESIIKIKIPHLIIFVCFVISFNLWFLTLFFYHHHLFTTWGLVITLLVTLALTSAWLIITGSTIPKFLFVSYLNIDESLIKTTPSISTVTFYVLFEVIMVHVLFLYIQYFFRFKLITYLSIQFWFQALLYLYYDFKARNLYREYLKKHKT